MTPRPVQQYLYLVHSAEQNKTTFIAVKKGSEDPVRNKFTRNRRLQEPKLYEARHVNIDYDPSTRCSTVSQHQVAEKQSFFAIYKIGQDGQVVNGFFNQEYNHQPQNCVVVSTVYTYQTPEEVLLRAKHSMQFNDYFRGYKYTIKPLNVIRGISGKNVTSKLLEAWST